MRIQSLRDIHLSFPDTDGFWNTQDLQQTEGKIRALLPVGNEPVQASQVEALTQIARVFVLQGNLKEAKDFLAYATTLISELSAEDAVKPQLRILLEEGRVYGLSMYPDRALELFGKAWNQSYNEKTLDSLAVDAAYMISVTLPKKEGRVWLKAALELAERADATPVAKKWLAHLYMRVGWQEFDVRNFELALDFFKKAEACADPGDVFLQRTLKWCIARVLRTLGKFNEAMAIQNDIFTDMAGEGILNGHVYLELAECYQSLQQQEQATYYYELAHEKLKVSKWYSENFVNELSEILKKAKKKKLRQQQ